MCGFAGFLDYRSASSADERKIVVERMANAIRHRGPDDSGEWVDVDSGISLAHRRLSILDLSVEGHQPMVSDSGRYVISYNGEVYNFAELRVRLEKKGQRFRGHSDTEVILASIEEWGLSESVKKFIGMFAFAVWDRELRELHLVRDRLGIKPLCYGQINGAFVFASELKALRKFPGFNSPVDRNALSLMMRLSYVPAPYSIYEGVRKLLPGHMLTVKSSDHFSDLVIQRYWSVEEVALRGSENQFSGTAEEAVEALDELLRDVIGTRMVADVPLGAFLSGGYDSTLVVAIMQALAKRPVKTFSIGFRESAYNEAVYARSVANHLGTEHTELYVTSSEAQSVIPMLPTMFDEPFADPSQIPTYLVSRMARESVTVSLSGDGGDELFCGYNRYTWAQRVNRLRKVLPTRHLSAALTKISPKSWDRILAPIMMITPNRFRMSTPGDKLHKLANVLKRSDADDIYRALVSHWDEPDSVVIGGREPDPSEVGLSSPDGLSGFSERMMCQDLTSYLPNDILTKVDRASMAVSLEARVPLLDHRLVEFAWRLPQDLKVRDGRGKWILREVLDQYVPKYLMERPKMGFGVPIDEWLRGPLHEWASDHLSESRLKRDGYLAPQLVTQKWKQHANGERHWHYQLWNVLMFQSWLEAQESNSTN